MSSEVRAATEAELGDYIGCLRTAFLGEREVTAEEVAWKAAHTDLRRTFCAFSDGALCGTARTFPTDLTVPGGQVEGLGDHRGDGAADAPSQGSPEGDDAGDARRRLEARRTGGDPDGVGVADLRQVRLRPGERARLVRDTRS